MKNLAKIFFACIATTTLVGASGIFYTNKEKTRDKKTSTKKTERKIFSTNEVISVKILSQSKIKSLLFAPEKGLYQIIANGKNIASIDAQNALKISVVNDSLELKLFEKPLGRYPFVKLLSFDEEKVFKLKLLNPDRKGRFFSDNLSLSSENGFLRLINESKLDNYIAGVSEAEAGSRSSLEFYKVQSILARTYALGHINKHQAEGFNLCDQTHCQVFFGRSAESDILRAVAATKGKVVVDENMTLIDAAFHSNSGGQTVNSEDVWGKAMPYLRSVKDSFSLKMPNARWQRKMAAQDWLSYLKIKHNYPVEDSLARKTALHFLQETRKANLEFYGVRVPLKSVRNDLQLKSTFFSIETQGDSVVFLGKGFGHGIGMCQEGAMRMTKMGYNYKDVLHFYYKNVHLIDIKELNFFRE
ncbi:MAG: SpoIID/LytB domain-containing protein [Bacteroidetes bacterium]|nr:SpoIID/LytB domain-containing protein [Bacteroidota bacterium]